MTNFQITFDAPRLNGGKPSDDPVVVLSQCATLGDVHRAFPNVHSMLAPFFGSAASHGTTKQLTRAFARLLHHPLGPSVGAEALGLAVTASGLVASPALAIFFDEANETTSSRQPIDFGCRNLFRDQLRHIRSPRRRALQMQRWWRLAHQHRCGPEQGWCDPLDWLAVAPAALLTEHLAWMPRETCEQVVRNPLLFASRHDMEGLARLLAGHVEAVLANPDCPDVLRKAIQRSGLPETLPEHTARFEWYTVSPIDTREGVDWEAEHHDWFWELRHPTYDPAVEIGWLTLPQMVHHEQLELGAYRALVAARDRPRSTLFEAVGRQLDWRERDVSEAEGAMAARLAESLNGMIFHAHGEWHVHALRTQDQIEANAKHMRNCTASIFGPPERTGVVLVALNNGEQRLNASVQSHDGHSWNVTAINSRFNEGCVPTGVQAEFCKTVRVAAQRVARQRRRTAAKMCTECRTERVVIGKVCLGCRGDDQEDRSFAHHRQHR